MLDLNFDLRRKVVAFSLNKEKVKCKETGKIIDRLYCEDHKVMFDDEGYILNIWNLSPSYCDFSETPVEVPYPGSELKFKDNKKSGLEEKVLWFPWLMTMCSAENFCKDNTDHHIIIEYKKPSNKSSGYDFDWIPFSEWDKVKFRAILTGKAYVIEKEYKTPYEYLPASEIIVVQNYGNI